MKKFSRVKQKAKWALAVICLSVLILSILAFAYREKILQKAGEFMAPRGEYTADVAILGGTSFLNRSIPQEGFELLKAGKVKRLVVVLHNINPLHRPYGYNDNYPEMVAKEIRKSGLKQGDFEIVVTHIHHPLTLIEAQGAMKAIARMNVKSAILLTPGFHTRRSYLVYQYTANPYGIKIYPRACFNGYDAENWSKNDAGRRDFAAESAKLIYYVLWGHIPFKFDY